MPVSIKALIARTEAALATETDPAQLRVLEAKLGAFLARAEMDGEGGDDGKDGEDGKDGKDGEDGEDGKSAEAAAAAKRAAAKAKAAASKAKAAKCREEAAGHDDDAKAAEAEGDDDGGDAKALLAAGAAGALSPGAAAALASQGEITSATVARVERLERSAAARELTAMIGEAKAQRRITPGEARALASKSASFVKDFLEMRPRAIVAVDEDALEAPDQHATAADIPREVKVMIEGAVTRLGLTGDKAEDFRKQSYADQRAAKAGLNGSGSAAY